MIVRATEEGSKPKRNVTLVDQSGKQVTLTLWDYLADEVLESHGVVLCVCCLTFCYVQAYSYAR